MDRLKGKVAVITGAAQGIGRGMALLFARQGAAVMLADIQDDGGHATTAEIVTGGGRAAHQTCDVGEPADVEQLVARAEQEFGPVSVLVNNASVFNHGDAVDLPLDEWTRMRRAVYDAAFLGARYAVPSMRRAGGGSIITIASVHGLLAARRSAAYEAAKGALITLTKQLAVDFGPDGIRANCICPGLIVTEKHAAYYATHPERARLAAEMYPLRRYGVPDDVARAALFLASDESSFITGHALVVDGGLTTQLQDDLAQRMFDYVQQGA